VVVVNRQRPHTVGNNEAKEYRNTSCHIRNSTRIPRLFQPVAELQHLSVTFLLLLSSSSSGPGAYASDALQPIGLL